MLNSGSETHPLNRAISRRRLLQFGLPTLGLGLADILHARSVARTTSSSSSARGRSLIVFWTHGGMSQQDTYDLKPDAPSQFRGAYRPIATSAPGDLHHGAVPSTGEGHGPALPRPLGPPRQRDPRPLGPLDADRLFRADPGTQRPPEAVVRLRDRPRCRPSITEYASLCDRSPNPKPSATRVRSTWERPISRLRSGPTQTPPISRSPTSRSPRVSRSTRCAPRSAALREFDTLRRDIDASGVLEGLDTFKAQAFEMVTGDRVRQAFDIRRRTPACATATAGTSTARGPCWPDG